MLEVKKLSFQVLVNTVVDPGKGESASQSGVCLEEIYQRTGLGSVIETLDKVWSSDWYTKFGGYEDLITTVFGRDSLKGFAKKEIKKILVEEQALALDKNTLAKKLTERFTRFLFEGNLFHPVSRAESVVIDEVLKTLSEREEFVLRKRFGLDSDPMTLVEVGTLLSVSRERVRQCEAKALRKLRHPSRSRNFRQFWRPIKERYLEAMDTLTALRAPVDDLDLQAEYALSIPYVQKLKGEYESQIGILRARCEELALNQKDPQPVVNLDILETPIEELEISVRLYNCLRGSGFGTLRDIVGKSQPEIYSISNLGKKSFTELLDMLVALGLELRE